MCVCYLPRIDIVSVLLLTHVLVVCGSPPLTATVDNITTFFYILSPVTWFFQKKDKKNQRQILGPEYISLISPDILGRGCMRRCAGVARPSVTSKTGEKSLFFFFFK